MEDIILSQNNLRKKFFTITIISIVLIIAAGLFINEYLFKGCGC